MVWRTSVRLFEEIWENKILSLFYLIVMGAQVFTASKNMFQVDDLVTRVVISSVMPVSCFCVLVCFTVWMLEVFGHTRVVGVIKEATREFFQIVEDDSHEEMAASVRMTLRQRAWYVAMDYWAVFACMGVVAVLNYFKRDFIEVVMATAVYDFLVAWGFMIYSLRTGKDVTFGNGYRRAIDVIHRESKIVGYLGMVVLNAKATIWDGPEQVPIFFKKEIGGFGGMTLVLVFLAAIQGLFWAWLYSYGYESVFEAIRAI
ncbi:MAG: hypothetical protein WC823_00425 [Parcubacteria group bacterium]|jgi:hypothetical protein